jgi:putative addiction module component (TIGR02574 family)
MIDNPTLDRLMALPAADRLALAEQLWNSVSENPAHVPVPQWHLDILAERLGDDEASPADGESWAEARREIERKR